MNNKESLKRTARTVAYLIYARESKKLTRAKVAVRCGISQNMLVRYECGSSIPPFPCCSNGAMPWMSKSVA